MKKVSNWKSAIAFITLTFLSLLGVKTASATIVTADTTQPETQSSTPFLNSGETLLAQTCPYGGRKSPYARVTTQQGASLNIRSSPNGRIIGAVPNGWAVVPGRKDPTGRWTYLDYGTYYRYPSFISAPTLRSGWVSTAFLRQLGSFCEKPVSMMRSNLKALSGTKQVLVNEDLVQMGDRIASRIPEK